MHATQYRSFQGRPFQAECTQTHNNGTVSLTFTIKKQKVQPLQKHKIQITKNAKFNIVTQGLDYRSACDMAVYLDVCNSTDWL